MSLSSIQSLAALLLLLNVLSYIRSLQFRQLILTACNVGVIYILLPNAESGAALAAFLLTGYLVALLLKRWPSRLLLGAYVVALVVAFIVIRRYEFLVAWLPEARVGHAISIVGLSYMLFRQIHFLVDVSQGQVERMALATYANYQLSLFTILSGPIQRYQEFDHHWNELESQHEDRHEVHMAFLRMMLGYFKLAVIAPLFLSFHEQYLLAFTSGVPLSSSAAVGNFFIVLYSFPIYLYLNFSGYTDVVIAAATFVGMKLPENFDKPYLSRNVIDFWTRFHRTLGLWIRDYLFLPLYKSVAQRWPKKADSLAFLCYFLAFFLAGVWHGSTTNFVVYGALQAAGVSGAKLWERHLVKRGGRARLREYMQSTRVRAIAILATLHFEFFSLLFFPNDIGTVVLVLRSLFNTVS